ncbi:centrosomal protein of 120 kDa [Armigeres subalbatus]|uniref:centrosomal protein of 120 kDa n=1 Tax=Armigeres subalbatus TaxID=124917 RepID=UPI002ED2118B
MEHPPDQLVIALHILDAINFHRSKNTPIMLSASLDRNVLETECRLPGIASTSFDSNLVWETDRRSVKRMKTENLPIKVECYAVDPTTAISEAKPRRSLIGHLVLPLRSVPLLPWAKADSVKPRWFRVIGLVAPEWKSQKPEVQLAVVITDKEYLNPDRRKPGEVDSEKEGDRNLVIFTNPEPSRLGSGEGLPIRLLEERGLLQLGSEDQECDIFLVKIVLKYAKQLAKLLPDGEKEVLEGNFRMRYDLLGDNYPCSLEKRPNGTFAIQEKIVINFRTTLHSLKRYFEEIFLIRLEVLYAEKVIGRCYFRFGNLIQDEPLSKFLSKQRETATQEVEKFYPIQSVATKYEDKRQEDDISDISSSTMTSIKCKFSLKYLSSDRKSVPEPVQKILDLIPEKDLPIVDIPEVPSIPSINLNPIRPLPMPSAAPPEKTDIESILHCEDRDLRDVPRTFSYNLLLQSVKFTHRPPPGLWQMSLYHPRGDTPFTKVTMELDSIESETVEFPNLQLQLYFSALPDRVLPTITAECSKLSVNGPHGLFGFARLDNQSLVIGTKEKQAGVLILEDQAGESVGMATVFSFLDEVGINFNSRAPHIGPEVVAVEPSAKGHLDDQISYKMLEELKQWMTQQREQFLIELKQKEVAYLTKLTTDWKRKQAKEREELSQRLEHASALTVALEETKKSIAQQIRERVEQDRTLEDHRTKLALSHQQQLADIREKATRLEEDLTHRTKLQKLRCQELEEKNDSLIRDNDILKLANERLEVQLSDLKGELQEYANQRKALEQQYQELEKSKLFYKQQWAKMIRQVHKMKLEDEQKLGELIQGKEYKEKKKSSWWADHFEEDVNCIAAKEKQEMDAVHDLLFEDRWMHHQHSQHHHPHQCCSKDRKG